MVNWQTVKIGDGHPKGRLSDEEYLKRYGHPRREQEGSQLSQSKNETTSQSTKTNKSAPLIQNSLNDTLLASTVSESDARLSLEDAGLNWDELTYDLGLDEVEVLQAGQFLNLWQKRDEERYKKAEANFTIEKQQAFRQRMQDAYIDNDLADIICNEKQVAGSLLGGEYVEDYDPMDFSYYIDNADYDAFNDRYPEDSIMGGLQNYTEDFRNRDNAYVRDALYMVNKAIKCAEPQDVPMSRIITADDLVYYGNFRLGQKFDIKEPRAFTDGKQGISIQMKSYITNNSAYLMIIEGASTSVNISAVSGYVNQSERLVSGSFEVVDVYTIMGRQIIKIKQILED